MKITYKHDFTNSPYITNQSIIDELLKGRGITDKNLFLNPKSPLDLSIKDFGYEKQLQKAMKILEEVKEKDQTVVVYTDYDADGITGGAILWETLHLLGFKAKPYVPQRQSEGYGFSVKGIDNVKKEFDPALIISVDHGIAAVDQIAYAKSIGVSVIVTDHHHKREQIPEAAEAIFHIPLLSGSGVSYFFSKEIYNHFKNSSKYPKLLEKHFSCDYLALASIGTIADLVPLTGPSRSVVKHGLDAFKKIKRAGITCILKESAIDGKIITPYEVGFTIAPRINAVGRLQHAIDALRLLCTTDIEKATTLAASVGDINTVRQNLVKKSVDEAQKMVKEWKEIPKVIVLFNEDWHEGIIGLIASKIAEEHYRPVIVMTANEGHWKGSARSTPSFHITEFFTSIKDVFVNYGGHAQAAGFTILKKNLEKFLKTVKKESDKLIKDEDLVRVMEADVKAPVSGIRLSLAKDLEKLQPFGIGNSQPTFFSEVEVANAKLFGKKTEHLKISVKDIGKPGFPLELIAFSQGDRFTELSRGKKLRVIYQIEVDRWGARENIRGKLKYMEEMKS